jgi:hypothetical protein
MLIKRIMRSLRDNRYHGEILRSRALFLQSWLLDGHWLTSICAVVEMLPATIDALTVAAAAYVDAIHVTEERNEFTFEGPT